jgi:hypothetical protein
LFHVQGKEYPHSRRPDDRVVAGILVRGEGGQPGVTNFFAFATVGLLIAIFVVALSRSESRRR